MGSAEIEYRCFVGGLAWSTVEKTLEEAFGQYGDVIESKVCLCCPSQRSDLTRPV